MSGSFSQTQKFGKMSGATEAALAQINVQPDKGSKVKFKELSQAKEFEEFRRLPKFSHVPMAVIHPSPTKKRPAARGAAKDFELVAD